MKTIAFHNLGCKVNSYELDYMSQTAGGYGYEIVEFEQKADIYVINTCSVTNIADRKSRQMIHKAKKNNPCALVVAVGCFVQANPEEVMKDGAIDIIVGNNKKKDIFEIIKKYEEEKNNGRIPSKNLDGETLINIKQCEYEEMKVSGSMERSRAYVKIQDGCDRFCTYCIIPYTRGNIRSRAPEDVIEEIKGMVKNGYHEVVLTGIHISSYGRDFEESKGPEEEIASLLHAIDGLEGVERIRIGSFEPMILSEEFVKNLSQVKKLCPHFHISLQSGSDTVLKRMNRHYDTKKFYEKTVILRKYFPGCAITTDVIVGFPGETNEEFEETRRFLEKVEFFETHIFPYSRRKGTIADKMPNQLTMEEKKERVRVLLDLDSQKSEKFRESKVFGTSNVLIEEKVTSGEKEYYIGHTPEYVMTGIPVEEFEKIDNPVGKVFGVKILSVINGMCVAKLD